jgi:hypothetical protein
MKQFNLKSAAYALLISASFAACKKEKDSPKAATYDIKEAKKFFETNAPQYENFNVDASTGGLITTTKGTKINFPANAFKKTNGQIVSGNVTVSVKDIFNASDMLLGNRPTNSGGGMLISYGEMTVKANQGTDELQLNAPAQVQVPAAPKPAAGQQMRDIPMWSGDSAVTYTINGTDEENNNITLIQTGYIPRGINWNTTGAFATNNMNGTSSFNLDSLGVWRNCDALMSDPRPKTTVLGYFSNQWNPATSTSYMGGEPSMLFFKVKQQNTLVKLYNKITTSVPGKNGLLSYQNSFPIGLEGTFLAITFNNNKIYAEMKDVTVAAPASGKTYCPVTFALSEVTESQLLSLIQQLNTK